MTMAVSVDRTSPRPARGPAPSAGASAVITTPQPTSLHARNRPPTSPNYPSAETADDVSKEVQEGPVMLDVLLPSGRSLPVTVRASIPMLDLLVHLASRCKVAPTSHVLQVLDKETGRNVDFKPNQTIGSVGATTVHLVPKSKRGEGGKADMTAKTFEITNRFTINLPGGQKAVMRISPQLTLQQVLGLVCQDKSLDSTRYTLQHPAKPRAQLDLTASIAHIGLTEINLIHTGVSTSTHTMPNPHRSPVATQASKDPAPVDTPGSDDPKKKKGFLSFLSKKDKKSKSKERKSNSPSSPQPALEASRGYPESDANLMAPAGGESPGDASSSQGNKAGSRSDVGKKRPAPPPPQPRTPHAAAVPATGDSQQTPLAASAASSLASPPRTPHKSTLGSSSAPATSVKGGRAEASDHNRLHARDSSGSQGYPQFTVDSESPEPCDISEPPETSGVSSGFKSGMGSRSMGSTDKVNGHSGTKAVPASCEASEGQVCAVQEIDVVGRGHRPRPAPSTKKRKAPPPPSLQLKEAPAEHDSADGPSKTTGHQAAQTPTSQPETHRQPCPPSVETDTRYSAEPHTYNGTEREELAHDKNDLGPPPGAPPTLNGAADDMGFEDNPPLTHAASTSSGGPKAATPPVASPTWVGREDADGDVQVRPCTFIPPPPPDEPPPAEEDVSTAATQYVNDVVVSSDDTSLNPPSLGQSPQAQRHSRSNSRISLDSMGSTDTAEGLSLEFAQTIASGQEALDNESRQRERASSEEKAETPDLTSDYLASSEDTTSTNSLSVPDTNRNPDTGSVGRSGLPHLTQADSLDSQSSHSSGGQSGDPASVDGQQGAGMEVEESYAPVEAPPPLEFQDEEGEEEECSVVREQRADPSYRDDLPSRQGPWRENRSTPKEVVGLCGVFRAVPISIVQEIKTSTKRKEPAKPVAQKEEFVLTVEDLSSVSLVPKSPTVSTPPKSTPQQQPQVRPAPHAEPRLTGRYRDPDVKQSYTSHHPSTTSSEIIPAPQQTGKTQASDSNSGHPFSLLNLPTMRYSGTVSPLAFSDDDRSSEASNMDHVTDFTARQPTDVTPEDDVSDVNSENADSAGSRGVSGASSPSVAMPAADLDTAREELQQQYTALQDQFVLWQQQLQHNQTLLAAHNGVATDTNEGILKTLQEQVQVQQQMMAQLRMSMEALNVQQDHQQHAASDDSEIEDVPPPLPTSSPPHTPPPSPPPPPPPVAPPPPVMRAPVVTTAATTRTSTRPAMSRPSSQLDPREELMISIRSFGGRSELKPVLLQSAKRTHNKT